MKKHADLRQMIMDCEDLRCGVRSIITDLQVLEGEIKKMHADLKNLKNAAQDKMPSA